MYTLSFPPRLYLFSRFSPWCVEGFEVDTSVDRYVPKLRILGVRDHTETLTQSESWQFTYTTYQFGRECVQQKFFCCIMTN